MDIFERRAADFCYWRETRDPDRYGRLYEGLLPAPAGLALDVGCGGGPLSFHLADLGWTVLGIDLSRPMAAIAGRRALEMGSERTGFAQADIERPPFAAASFDLVVSDSVLHSTRMEVTLERLKGLLRPGGTLLVTDAVDLTPGRRSSRLRQLSGTLRRAPGYVRRFGWSTTVRLLSFEFDPGWIRHRIHDRQLAPDEFRSLFTRHFPGCTFLESGWTLTARWVAPAPGLR